MVRFSQVVMAYFFIGALMWGGGVIDWEQAGVGNLIIQPQEGGAAKVNTDTGEDLQGMGGPIKEAVSSVSGGALLAIWNIVVKIIGYLFWPITALQSVDAPSRVVVVGGGGFTMALFVSFLLFIRRG